MAEPKGRKPLEPWQAEDAKRLRALFQEHAKISQERFAQDYGIGTTQGAVWQYLAGHIALNVAAALKFARGLGVEVSDFSPTLASQLYTSDSPPRPYNAQMTGKVPLISWVQAGNFSSIVDNDHAGYSEDWVDTTVPIRRHTYALRVRGDSMTNPAGEPSFPDGQVIIVEPDAVDAPEKLVGQFVIVKRAHDEEATFKQLVKDAGKFYLKPLNPRYPMLELSERDAFCGVVREKLVRFF